MSDETITAYKCTRADGTDFHSGKFSYLPGNVVEEPNADASSNEPCGRGLHVSPTPRATCQYGNRSIDRGKWRWFEVEFNKADLLGKDSTKFRVRKLRSLRELTIVDIFGGELADRIKGIGQLVDGFKAIPWLKPARYVTEEEVSALLAQWRDALDPFFAQRGRNREEAPRRARIVRTHALAVSAASSAQLRYGAADAAAAAAAADAAADADAADAAAADAAAAAAAAAALRPLWPYNVWWYTRPYYVLWRHARYELFIGGNANPWKPFVDLYNLGCVPLGYATLPDDPTVAFTVYCPEPKQ